MKIELIGSTNNLEELENMKKFSYGNGRICYTEKDWEEVKKELVKKELLDSMLNSGHHSIFEHMNLGLYLDGIKKILAMVLNNEKQYATSEKSARYTKMKDIDPIQNEKYEKWMDILVPKIEKVYPELDDKEKRDIAIKKLAKENARYMTSVFTPTKMTHTINLRQLNFIIDKFEKYYETNGNSGDDFKKRISQEMKEFVSQTKRFKVEGLQNQTDRHLSLFNPRNVGIHFGDVYSTQYYMSFASLAQAQRHRTINYNIIKGLELDAPQGFFIPKIIRENNHLDWGWVKDLNEIARTDYPQAQLLKVGERGIIEDFRSKCFLRICGHAMYETMQNTLETAREYTQYQEEYGKKALKPKCLQEIKCPSPCVWKGKRALERIV
jgi:hypothetical protein